MYGFGILVFPVYVQGSGIKALLNNFKQGLRMTKTQVKRMAVQAGFVLAVMYAANRISFLKTNIYK